MARVYCFQVLRSLKVIQDLKKCNLLIKLQKTIDLKRKIVLNISTNKRYKSFDDLEIHTGDNLDSIILQYINKFIVSSIRYQGLTFEKNMKWNLPVTNIMKCKH